MTSPPGDPSPESPLRPALARLFGNAWVLVAAVFVVHAVIRFGGLADPVFVPLSLAIIWPLPWLLATRDGRRAMGFRAPDRWHWFVLGPIVAIGALVVCAVVAWGVFGGSEQNWFHQHARALAGSLARLPGEPSATARFWVVTGPALVFSPFAEEFLYRGFMLGGLSGTLRSRAAMFVQAAAFALVHLAHYGLVPFQPALIAVWVPSMFLVALLLGWIVRRGGSVWPAVAAHAVFNLGMNAVVFALLPNALVI